MPMLKFSWKGHAPDHVTGAHFREAERMGALPRVEGLTGSTKDVGAELLTNLRRSKQEMEGGQRS
jgi:hypothetical protein